jgi:hypothetical protein
VVGWVWHIAELLDPDTDVCDSQTAKQLKKESRPLSHARR